MKAAAEAYRGWVFSRLMIWILLRSPKMNGAIFGFQKRVWCPKWTPASSICRMDTLVIKKLLVGLSLRVSQSATRFCLEIGALSLHFSACRVVKNSRALYHEPLVETKPACS